jgi:hypothetical protein
MPFLYLTLPREFELCCPKGIVRTEVHEVNRQAEARSGDEAAKLPSNLSGRAKDLVSQRVPISIAITSNFQCLASLHPVPFEGVYCRFQ